MMTRFSVKAVILGSVVDMVGSIVGSVALLVAMALGQGLRGVPADLMKVNPEGTAFLAYSMMLGLGFSILGGYVAARIAKARELAHAGATALPCIALGLLASALFTDAAPTPAWYSALSYIAVVPAAVLGGHFGRLRNRAVRGTV